MNKKKKKKKPECPARSNCVHGEKYPKAPNCHHRWRRKDGLFECLGFEETRIPNLDKLQPTIEIFEEYQ
jgi:hypothetical protein